MAGKRSAVGAWAIALAVMAGSAMLPAMAGAQSTQPASKSPLKRTKTKLKPPAAKPTRTAPNASKPLSNIKPTGRKETPKQGPSKVPIEGIRRVIFRQNSMQELVRSNDGGEIDVPLDTGGTARVSEVFTTDGMPSQDRAMRNVVRAVREGRTPKSNQELQDMVRGSQRSVAAARDEYLAKGFQEVRMSNNEVVFVKSDDPCGNSDIASMLEDRVSERMYRVWMDDWNRNVSDRNDWIYEGGAGGRGCRTCSGGACSTTTTLDTFILRGTLEPRPEPTENELAELEMTDAERAENALALHDFSLAVERYASYLKSNPEDADALRGYSIALLQDDRLIEAVSKMSEAYTLDPMLAGRPVSVDFFENGPGTITELLQRVVPLAHRSPTYAASLASAVLMQAQGRTKEATRMLERASEKGLPDSVSREFTFVAADAKVGSGK